MGEMLGIALTYSPEFQNVDVDSPPGFLRSPVSLCYVITYMHSPAYERCVSDDHLVW